MVARSTSSLQDVSSLPQHDPGELGADPTHATVEPVRPSDAQRQHLLGLAPPPRIVALVAGGVAAALAGGAVGYWLGRRSAPRPARTVRRLASRIDSAAELAPVAMGLLANPLIRALVIRLLMRQMSRRIGR